MPLAASNSATPVADDLKEERNDDFDILISIAPSCRNTDWLSTFANTIRQVIHSQSFPLWESRCASIYLKPPRGCVNFITFAKLGEWCDAVLKTLLCQSNTFMKHFSHDGFSVK
jgi:hypothetical protein